jgi:hypothetical protein
MSARHGGPGTHPAHDRAGTLDTNLTSTTSRSRQTHCADSQPATCPGSPSRQRQTPTPSAAPRPGAVRIDTDRHTAREAADLTAAATRWPGHGRGPGIPDHAPRLASGPARRFGRWHSARTAPGWLPAVPAGSPASGSGTRPAGGSCPRSATASLSPRRRSARTASSWPPAATARPSGSGPWPSRRATPAAEDPQRPYSPAIPSMSLLTLSLSPPGGARCYRCALAT